METEKNRGMSPELAKKYPRLRFIRTCAGAFAMCDLMPESEGMCDKLRGHTTLSQNKGGELQVVKILPGDASECADCQLHKDHLEKDVSGS